MSLHTDFAAALLAPEGQCPEGLVTANGSDPAVRFAVYRNNVQSALVGALADSYPVLVQLVGEAFFRAMALVYVRQAPPRSALLVDYGGDFAEFVEGFAPAASVPYLAAVARLERARVQAYHAADSQPLTAEQLATALARPETLGDLCFSLHASVAVISAPYALVSIWQAHHGGIGLATFDPLQAQHALVLRCQWQVLVQAIDAGCANFVRALQQGQPLGLAAATAVAADVSFDLAASLALLLQAQALCAQPYR